MNAGAVELKVSGHNFFFRDEIGPTSWGRSGQ